METKVSGLYKPCHTLRIRTAVHHGVRHIYHFDPDPINLVYANMWLVAAVGCPLLSGITGQENVFYLQDLDIL